MNRYVVVARSKASAIFYPGTSLTVPTQFFDWGTAHIVFRTNYLDQGYSAHVPKGLWVEITGEAPDLVRATSAFVGFAGEICTIIALCANATMGQIETELALDVNPESEEHEFV